jgi:hypothetical protein
MEGEASPSPNSRLGEHMPYKTKEEKAAYDHARVAQNREEKSAYDKNYRSTHRTEKDAYSRKHHLQKNFNLSFQKFFEMLTAQDNKCALCSDLFEVTPAIDHDHSCCSGVKSCGKCVRGLLCHRCNTALGSFRDSPELLRKAADYIERKRNENFNVPISLESTSGLPTQSS